MQLWRELRDQGFTGKAGIVRLWATQRRRDLARGPAAARRPAVAVPTSRQATRLVLADATKLDAAERKLVATLINAVPEITEAVGVARTFGAMIRQSMRPTPSIPGSQRRAAVSCAASPTASLATTPPSRRPCACRGAPARWKGGSTSSSW